MKKTNYKIEEVKRQWQGRTMSDLILTFSNGKKFILVPLCPNDNKKMKSYFYALLDGSARK